MTIKSMKMINQQYNDGSYLCRNKDWHSSDAAWKAKQIRAIMSRNNICPSNVTDVGCGTGDILLQLQNFYPDTSFVGYESSKVAYEMCAPKSRKGLEFKLVGVDEKLDQSECLICIDVIEHVEDVFGFLRFLKPFADTKIFHIPLEMNVNGILRGGPIKSRKTVGHLHYFSAETAIATLEDVGFEIIDFSYTPAFASSGQANKGFIRSAMKIPRHLLFKLSPSFLSKTLGGPSLIVLAK